jgi:hypothetical protein
MFARLCGQAQLPNDAAGDRRGIIKGMGPEPDDTPPGFAERPGAEAISGDVTLQFWKPISLIATGLATVLWASMPEATVHENHDVFAAKGEIGVAGKGLMTPPAGDPMRPEYRCES